MKTHGRTFVSMAEVRRFESARGAKDAPPAPKGKILRAGVEYGCGKIDCTLCYEDAAPLDTPSR